MWGPFSSWGGDLGLSGGSLQGTQTSFHLLIWTMSMHEASAEIWPSFESGHLGVHFAWSIKHRLPLTYIFLRENSSWCTGGMMAYLFIRRQGISSHLQTIWGAQIFHPVAILKLMFLETWDGCLRESLDGCKWSQATCCIWCGIWDGYGFNEGEMCFILSWFGVHQSILHWWGDISVPLLLWQCSWVFSLVPSG